MADFIAFGCAGGAVGDGDDIFEGNDQCLGIYVAKPQIDDVRHASVLIAVQDGVQRLQAIKQLFAVLAASAFSLLKRLGGNLGGLAKSDAEWNR